MASGTSSEERGGRPNPPQGRIQEFFKGGARLIKVIKSGRGSQKGVGAGGGYAPSRAKRGSFWYYLSIKALKLC